MNLITKYNIIYMGIVMVIFIFFPELIVRIFSADETVVAYGKKALQSMGYASPTDVQIKAIPEGIKGRDVIAAAATGNRRYRSAPAPSRGRRPAPTYTTSTRW